MHREVLERLSGAVETTLERAQRGQCAGERPLEGAGNLLGAERFALFGEQRFHGNVATGGGWVRRGGLEQVGYGDSEGPGELDGDGELEVVVSAVGLDVLDRAGGQAAGLREVVAREPQSGAAGGDQAAVE